MFVRNDISNATLSFFTFMPPNHSIEVSRIVTTHAHLKEIADVICRNLNHYPEKQADSK